MLLLSDRNKTFLQIFIERQCKRQALQSLPFSLSRKKRKEREEKKELRLGQKTR